MLHLSDLDGRVLTIERGLSARVLGSTKLSRARRLTLGRTVAMIHDHVDAWNERCSRRQYGASLFSTDPSMFSSLTNKTTAGQSHPKG